MTRCPQLSTFFPELDPDHVRRVFWEGRDRLVAHGSPERFAELLAAPELATIDTAIAAHRGPLKAVYESERLGVREVEIDTGNTEAAESLYDAGLSLCAGSFDRDSPAVQRVVARLAAELRMSVVEPAYVNLYASPPGGGFGRHFDSQRVLVLQVRGHKQWKLLPNPELPYPTTNCTPNQPTDELRLYYQARVSQQMPPESETVEMVPGSVLLLPPGYWHSTRTTDQHSLSLTFTFRFVSRIDLLLSSLRSHLLGDTRWREPLGPDWDDQGRSAAVESLVALATELGAALPGLAEVQLLDAFTTPELQDKTRARYRRRAEARLRLEGDEGERSLAVIVPGREEARFELEEELVPLLRWLADHEQWFHLVDARRLARYAHTMKVSEALEVLTAHGALEHDSGLGSDRD